jgi:hypothetical protein
MLNRTNRMLSANLNRLNLGTGSLASREQVRFNHGTQTQHVRHAYPVVMRAGTVGDPVDPRSLAIWGCVVPSIPGSPSVSPWLIASCAIHPKVAADSSPFTGPAKRLDQPGFKAEEPGPRPAWLSTSCVRAGQGKPAISGPTAAFVAAVGG